MDASGLYLNSQNRTDNVSETGSDIISDLPESILTQILSLLPTKDAVGTSALSKQWKYMWTNVTKLHFDSSLLLSNTSTKRFMNFMERVLTHLENDKLESFYLSCENHCDASRVNTWVSAATRRQARRIDICYCNHKFELPRCVFENEAVKELRLCVNCTIIVSPPFFSRLETLDLSGVTFLTCFSEPTEFTFTFPNLKVLTLCGVKWLNLNGIDVDVPSLNLDVPALHSFKWFPYRNNGCVIKMSGQNLKKFGYSGSLAEEIVMHCASSVVDVTIQVYGNQKSTSRVIRACNLLRLFVGVENLTISSEIFRALAHKKNLQAVLPTYNNLVRLNITWQSVVVDGTFMALLRSAPVLRTLMFSKGILLYKKKEVEEMVPECFSSHLKVVEFKKFTGGKDELDFAKFLLSNAMELEVMAITAFGDLKWGDERNLVWVKRQLSNCTRGSSRATISFS